MNKPSSTITAASLSGLATTVGWGLITTFSVIEPSAMLVSGSTALAAGLVGYLKKENVLSK